MNKTSLSFLFLLFSFCFNCNHSKSEVLATDTLFNIGKGVLLTTRFNSFEEFKKEVSIDYHKGWRPWTKLTREVEGYKIESILKSGISENDIMKKRNSNIFGKASMLFISPYSVMHRYDLMRIFLLSRRRHNIYGWKDIAFYDIAELMTSNISKLDLENIPPKDLSEKGYINTFNHVVSQAIMTTLFSETFADFIADLHERKNMPELITGDFTEQQKEDIENGPVDNYIDMLNNEYGQEIGKVLKAKYAISSDTYWTPKLLSNYLNEIQRYFSWVFQIGFSPFESTDEPIIKFTRKINLVMSESSL